MNLATSGIRKNCHAQQYRRLDVSWCSHENISNRYEDFRYQKDIVPATTTTLEVNLALGLAEKRAGRTRIQGYHY